MRTASAYVLALALLLLGACGERTRVVLIATPEPGLLPSPPAFYAEIARELRVPHEPAVITEVLKDASLKSDPIHPNARGYLVIAERLAGLLKQSGAI